ncbi:MAG: hypothetical protein ACLFM0_11535 [Spirochaetales bacterium]
MTSVRSRLSVKRVSADTMLVQISPVRRWFYGIVAGLLVFGMFSAGIQPVIDAGFHAGTVFYSIVVLISLGAAGWNVRMTFDRHKGVVSTVRRFFGVSLSRRTFRYPDLKRFYLRRIVLFRGFRGQAGGERPNIAGIGRGGLSPRRKELGRLYLVPEQEKPELIEESSDLSELWAVAEQLSEFTGLNVESEEV